MAHVFQTFDKNGKPHPRYKFEYRDWKGRKRKATGTTSKEVKGAGKATFHSFRVNYINAVVKSGWETVSFVRFIRGIGTKARYENFFRGIVLMPRGDSDCCRG